MIKSKSFNTFYPILSNKIMNRGKTIREAKTIEISPFIFQIMNSKQKFLLYRNLNFNYQSLIMKRLQILNGTADIKALCFYDTSIKNRIDPFTGLYDGAYGPRIKSQMDYIYQLLKRAPTSRRAVISIYSQKDQNRNLTFDIPSTVSLQFLLRKNKLNLICYMRSNDFWNGLPFDVGIFTFLQEVMASWLKTKLGTYTHFTGSAHIYLKDLQNPRAVISYLKSNSSSQTKSERRWTMFVYIGGVPGVGKTTVVTEVEELARKRKIKMEKIKGASILCELAGVATVTELRALPESVRRVLRPEMNRRLYAFDRVDPGTIRLADGHFVYFDFEGREYGVRQIQPWDKTQMIAITVIIASPSSILSRRLKETNNRPDRKHDINFLIQEQKMEIDVAISQARNLSIPFCFICNDGGEGPTAAETLLSFCIHQALCRAMDT